MARPRIVLNTVPPADDNIEVGTLMELIADPTLIVIVTALKGQLEDEFTGVILQDGEYLDSFVYDHFRIFKGTMTLSQGV